MKPYAQLLRMPEGSLHINSGLCSECCKLPTAVLDQVRVVLYVPLDDLIRRRCSETVAWQARMDITRERRILPWRLL